MNTLSQVGQWPFIIDLPTRGARFSLALLIVTISAINAKASPPTTTNALLAPFAQSPPRHMPELGTSCFFNVFWYNSTTSRNRGSEPQSPSYPILTLMSSVPIQTASIWSPTAVRMASRLRAPFSDSIWMMMAAWSLRFFQSDREGSLPASLIPGIHRNGGADRVPFASTPNLAAETMCWACSTVSTCGTMIEAPASRAYPIAAWSWPGTLSFHIRFEVITPMDRNSAYLTKAMVLPSLMNCISWTICHNLGPSAMELWETLPSSLFPRHTKSVPNRSIWCRLPFAPSLSPWVPSWYHSNNLSNGLSCRHMHPEWLVWLCGVVSRMELCMLPCPCWLLADTLCREIPSCFLLYCQELKMTENEI